MILTDFIHQRIRGMTEPAVNPATSLSITTDVKLIPQDERATTVTQRANYTGGAPIKARQNARTRPSSMSSKESSLNIKLALS